jgi:uncharacterized membrane protein YkvA (DUF1232 family)
MWWQVVGSLAAALALLWLLLLVVLWRAKPEALQAREILRLLPDVLRLLSRLARDPGLPRKVRWRLWAALGYLAVPIDLVPDVIPVLGYADDVVVVVAALRSVVRSAGPDALARHWPGSPEGLAALTTLAGLTPGTPG